MPANARNYRETIYRLRSHPSAHEYSDFHDQRDSLLAVYASLIPFLAFEYISEASTGMLPSGLIFPLGYLLFWAFYYTYYKPGLLEEKLTESKKGNFSEIPTLILGVLIWFVKVTFVELTHFMFTRWVVEKPNAKAHSQHGHHTHFNHSRPYSAHRPHKNHHHQQYQRAQTQGAPQSSSRTESKPPAKLPADIQQALSLLGIPDSRDWREIHKRYRELAKRFHPDLNPEVTAMGQRFMMYDAAYKKLQAVRAQYFPETR